MAATVNDDRILKPFWLSLSQLATVKVASTLLRFGFETLKDVFSDKQLENSICGYENKEDAGVKVDAPSLNDVDISSLDKAFANITPPNKSEEMQAAWYNAAKDYLLGLPPSLQKGVQEAVLFMHNLVLTFEHEHSDIFRLRYSDVFYQWHSNGTIDTFKIAQELVLDEDIKIGKRFQIACQYHLEKSVKVLWAQMGAKGRDRYLKSPKSIEVRFWVRWLSEGSRVPWTQAAGEYLELPQENHVRPFTRFSPFFSSLRPEDRRRFLIPLQWSLSPDLLLCLYSMSRDEQEIILRNSALNVLYRYFDLPVEIFLETARKLISFLDAYQFYSLLEYVLRVESKREEIDYGDAFLTLWNMSPDHLKEVARKDRDVMRKIDSYDHEMKRKGDVVDKECMKLKRRNNSVPNRAEKWVRRNGRLQSLPFTP